MSRQRQSDPRQGWVTLGLVVLAAIAFGVFAIPKLGANVGLEGKPAPDFALPVMHPVVPPGGSGAGAAEERLRLSEQRGRLVLLDFWASWCRPCREQTKVIEALRPRYAKRGLTVIGVNVSDVRANAAQYLAEVKPSWVVVEDQDDAANLAYSVEQLPTLVAIDRQGVVFAVRRRFLNEKELIALLEAMDG